MERRGGSSLSFTFRKKKRGDVWCDENETKGRMRWKRRREEERRRRKAASSDAKRSGKEGGEGGGGATEHINYAINFICKSHREGNRRGRREV